MTTENAATETTATKGPSALQKLLDENKGKKVNESDKKAATKAFVSQMTERAKLQAALDAHDAKTDDTAVAMVKCYGNKHVTVAGVRYVPTSRGDRVYYKRMNDQQDTVALD